MKLLLTMLLILSGVFAGDSMICKSASFDVMKNWDHLDTKKLDHMNAFLEFRDDGVAVLKIWSDGDEVMTYTSQVEPDECGINYKFTGEDGIDILLLATFQGFRIVPQFKDDEAYVSVSFKCEKGI